MSQYPQGRNEALHAVIYRAKLQARRLLHCPQCGARSKVTEVFCKKCGRKLPSVKDV